MSKLETTQYVKLTSRGKLSLSLSGNLKVFFLAMIEKLMQRMEHAISTKLDMSTVEDKKNFAIVSEIYVRHFAALCSNQPCKVHLSMSQALCLWQMASEYDTDFYADAMMGTMLMQLHQKLS